MANRSLTYDVKLTINGTVKNVLDNTVIAQSKIGGSLISSQLLSGVSDSQANRAWEATRTITSGNTEDLDLYDLANIDIGAGNGMDALGQAWVCEEVVTLYIKVSSSDDGAYLEVMPSQPTGYLTWAPVLTVANGAALKLNSVLLMHQPDADGFDISDGVSHVLRLKANGGDVTYDILVVGRHDDDESSSSSSSSQSSSASTSSTQSTNSSSSSSSSSSSVSSSSPSSQSTSTVNLSTSSQGSSQSCVSAP